MDLLYVRHPNQRLRKNQLNLLDGLSEPDKSEYARMLRLGNASMHYYYNDAQPTEDDYNHWISGLPDGFKAHMIKKGYEECKSILALQRHALERRDVGMDEFMKGILNEEDFKEWRNSSQ